MVLDRESYPTQSRRSLFFSFLFFFNDTPTTEIYTLSLHDALPICHRQGVQGGADRRVGVQDDAAGPGDRKSTRLNSSHPSISYAVFCLKKKKITPSSRLSSCNTPRRLMHPLADSLCAARHAPRPSI